jgi:predicted glycoside hydrolase/deacetylase ChbG (UPF0249 family)
MIRLIVSADDLGANPARNRGILEAFSLGIVTSASLLANGEAFCEAVDLAGDARLPVGVHLNLSEGFSLTGNVPALTDQQGRFSSGGRMDGPDRAGLCGGSCSRSSRQSPALPSFPATFNSCDVIGQTLQD